MAATNGPYASQGPTSGPYAGWRLICADCSVEFEWDESPSDERCVECAMRRAHLVDQDEATT